VPDAISFHLLAPLVHDRSKDAKWLGSHEKFESAVGLKHSSRGRCFGRRQAQSAGQHGLFQLFGENSQATNDQRATTTSSSCPTWDAFLQIPHHA
jgi:hypothetical protein